MTTRTIVGVAVGAVVLGLLVVAAVVGSGTSTTDYEPGTPEAAVQRYFQALIDNRPTDAYRLYSTELAEQCDRALIDPYSPPVSRVVLDDVTTEGSVATVVVRITETYSDGLLLTDENTFTVTLSLSTENGRWVFDQVPWPYPCPPPLSARTTTTAPSTTRTSEVEP